MAEMQETAGAGRQTGLNWSPLAFALRPAPPRFNPARFGTRLCQHLIIYTVLLGSVVYACAFAFAPLETSVISEVGIVLAVCIALFFSPSRQRLRRLVEGGIVTTYLIGAAVLLRAFDAIFRMM